MIPGIVYSWSWTIPLDELETYQFFAILSYDIHCIYFHIYIMMYVVFHLSLYVLFLFSLYTHVSLCMQSLFLFHTKMP